MPAPPVLALSPRPEPLGLSGPLSLPVPTSPAAAPGYRDCACSDVPPEIRKSGRRVLNSSTRRLFITACSTSGGLSSSISESAAPQCSGPHHAYMLAAALLQHAASRSTHAVTIFTLCRVRIPVIVGVGRRHLHNIIACCASEMVLAPAPLAAALAGQQRASGQFPLLSLRALQHALELRVHVVVDGGDSREIRGLCQRELVEQVVLAPRRPNHPSAASNHDPARATVTL